MLNGIISVCTVFVILAVGFFFTNRKLWPDNTNKVFSTTVVKIAAPSLAIVSIELIRNLALPRLQASLAFLPIDVAPNTFLFIYLILLVAGLIIGLIGSMLAMRRYLKV